MANLRKNGYPAIYVTGFWPQHATPPKLPDLVTKLAAPYAGYWIWCSLAFDTTASGGYAHAKEYTDDDYWKALREANALLDVRKEHK